MQSPINEHAIVGTPIEINGLKIIPTYRSTVLAFGQAVLATLCPSSLMVVDGQETRVFTLTQEVEADRLLET